MIQENLKYVVITWIFFFLKTLSKPRGKKKKSPSVVYSESKPRAMGSLTNSFIISQERLDECDTVYSSMGDTADNPHNVL